MREIKFRAWDKRNNLMIRDIFIISEYGTPSLLYPLVPPGLIWQQFTGLHDKNGKEIYEGDILQDSPTYKGICKYFNYKACFYIDRNEFGTGGKGYLEDSMEVIGNIYENSDWNWNGIEKLIKRGELAKTGYVSRKINKIIKVIDDQLQELEACRDANVQKKKQIAELESQLKKQWEVRVRADEIEGVIQDTILNPVLEQRQKGNCDVFDWIMNNSWQISQAIADLINGKGRGE